MEESVRLVDPSGLPAEGGSGVVEMCVNEQWSRICHETWDAVEAAVVCRQLGYSSQGKQRHFTLDKRKRYGDNARPFYDV